MIRLSIGQKIFYGFWAIILLSVAFLLISYPYLAKIDILSSMVLPLEREMETSQKYNERVKRLESKIELYLVVTSEETREEILAMVEQFNQTVNEAIQAKDSQHLRGILNLAGQINRAASTLISDMDKRDSAYKINLQILTVSKLFDKFEVAQKIFQRQNLRRSLKIVTEEKAIVNKILKIFLILEISIVLFGSLVAFFLTRAITRNLSKLRKGTQDIAAVNFETRIDISSNDEIGQLADSFNTMAEELRRKTVSRDYLDSIIHSMADMLVVVDQYLIVNKVNKAVCDLLGCVEYEFIGEPITKIFLTRDPFLNGAALERRIKEGKIINYEMYCRTKDNVDIPVLLSASVMKDGQGNTSYIICSAQDITAHKRAEEKEKEVIDMKAKLTSMVSYDLRTRMAAIYTGIYLILDGKVGVITDKQKHILGIAQRNLDKVTHLINNFLDFRKLEADTAGFVMEECDINEVVKEVHQEMKPLVEGKGLTFKLELSKKLPRIQFDRDRIAQVLINLISNAINFTEKGTITITTQLDKKGVSVSVVDTGIGIGKKDIQRIFLSFEHIYHPNFKGLRGTGLGLAVCREIIEKHKGKIWVDSQAAKGSTFHFVLPG
ncbi:MAG: cell wall metabolism sensor histidine kinase WalK [Omnitrophica bacterium]|nr:cell wall metabolism sensor histidine kinase WalK [Candidatus Omnitrophota bacterium]